MYDITAFNTTIAQSTAALAGLGGGFLVTRLLSIASERSPIQRKRDELQRTINTLSPLVEEEHDEEYNELMQRVEFFATLAATRGRTAEQIIGSQLDDLEDGQAEFVRVEVTELTQYAGTLRGRAAECWSPLRGLDSDRQPLDSSRN